jgi:hypothetical protein
MRQRRLEDYGVPENSKILDRKTLDNSSAMHGEAFPYVKYLLYAEHARKRINGNSRWCASPKQEQLRNE